MLLIQLSPSHSIYMVEHTALGPWHSHPIPQPSLHAWEWYSFLGFVSPNDMSNSEYMMGVKPGDSGVVIGCQVEEFTCTW